MPNSSLIPVQNVSQVREPSLAKQAVCSREAFAEFYRCHAPQLYRYFWLRTRCRATAEDLVSDTFAHALSSLHSYSVRQGSFQCWLYGIARHCLAALYSKKSIRHEGDDDSHSQRTGLPASAPAVEERIDLWNAVSTLRPVEQEIIALKFGSGFTYREIAEITGLREAYIGMLLCRALRKLRSLLDEERCTDDQSR